MSETAVASVATEESFRFSTRFHLSGLTGLKATNLKELLALVKNVPGSCIYHHTHRFLQQHQYLSPEPPNDFAYWVTEVLGERKLGERLSSIDTIQYSSIRELRDKIASVIDEYLVENPVSQNKFAHTGEEFHFIKTVSFILPTHYVASNLQEFVAILKKITIDSIYYHIFESRLRLEKKTNDFSLWIEKAVGDKQLAQKLAVLDPYTQTLEDLRGMIIRIIEKRMGDA